MQVLKKEQNKLAQRLERKNKELQNVLYVLSHDLGSPLLSIRAFTHELKRACSQIIKCVEDGASESVRTKVENLVRRDIQESLGYINDSTDEIGGMLEELKLLSRAGRANLDIKPLDMARIVKEQAENMKMEIEDAGIKIEVGQMPDCMGDEGQIRRVWDSLLANAARRVKNGQGGIIRIWGQQKDDIVVYTVQDNGPGLKPEEKEKIFEIFYHSDSDRNGSGRLGLAVVQQILERQDGWISVEAEEGQGASFNMALPAA
ncbi:MAG: ATP-binding protein [Phycisphaerae bacterium]|nr:ATP-binding protein [Phycisphaerae bacterium]